MAKSQAQFNTKCKGKSEQQKANTRQIADFETA